MLDRRQILAIFLFKFKMNHKALETACNINYTLAQKLLTNTQGTGASRNFTKEMAPWRWGGWWPAIESGQQPIKGHHWSSYSYTRSCPRTVSTILWSCIWSQLERWKSLISGCLMIWLKIKKNVILKYHLLILWDHFFIGLWYMTKNGFYTISDNQLSGWMKKKLESTSQSQTCTKKRVMVNVWWSSAPLIQYRFLNPRETVTSKKYAQQINEMHWELQGLQPALVNRKGPVLEDNSRLHVTQLLLQKLNELGYEVLAHLLYSPDVLPANYHFFMNLDNFCSENASTTSRTQKMLSKSLSNHEAWIFMLQE